MGAEPVVVSPADYASPLDVVGEHITVLASKEATRGWEVFLQEGPEGSGPPPHSHTWDECFFVLGGSVQFGYGDRALTAAAGTLVHIPAGTTHWFRFAPGGGRMLSVSGNGNASALFADIDREIPADAPDIPRLIAIARRNGLEMGA
ncbi:MAG: cupin domain-containing protein [Alphaproteobacteria bacterium]|nr:cupin domain-containing protein [Alphaproteobacteria bacterium]